MEVIDNNLSASIPLEKKYLIAYFGKQSDYYLDRYKAFHNGRQFTFNSGTFIAGMFWFLYRKLFTQLLICLAIAFAAGILEVVISDVLPLFSDNTTKLFDKILNIVLWVGFGFIGNYFYIKQADKNITLILSSTSDEAERMMRLKKKGGVSNIPYYILLVLILAIVIFALFNN